MINFEIMTTLSQNKSWLSVPGLTHCIVTCVKLKTLALLNSKYHNVNISYAFWSLLGVKNMFV